MFYVCIVPLLVVPVPSSLKMLLPVLLAFGCHPQCVPPQVTPLLLPLPSHICRICILIILSPCLFVATVKRWVETPENYLLVEAAFNSTTNYGRLHSVDGTVAGRNVYLRFCCMSGDAMGMNMVSKGCLKAIEVIELQFPDSVLVAISGNMCTDKKPSAINWILGQHILTHFIPPPLLTPLAHNLPHINVPRTHFVTEPIHTSLTHSIELSINSILGRGKSVVCEAVIPDSIVRNTLKSSVHDMIETNKQKNHIGSAMAGSIGGFNAHAANIVTAVFLATGQDPAQNVESSNCMTIMEYAPDGKSLHVSMPMSFSHTLYHTRSYTLILPLSNHHMHSLTDSLTITIYTPLHL